MTNLPTVLTKTGLQPQTPASLLAQLLAIATGLAPGLTANLPGALIEDVSSTDVGALTVIDSIRVDLVNSLTPYGANEFLLNQLGQVYGVAQGGPSNTSVFCVFSSTAIGFIIPIGFTVSDGSHQYVVQDGGIIASGGVSQPIACLASTTGSWAVPANTVTSLITSAPSTITLTVNNPTPGTPGDADGESETDYRARVLDAGQAVAQGLPVFLKTAVTAVPGVQSRLVSIRQAATSGFWEILVGGGDPYDVAYAIFQGLFDITTLEGSVIDDNRNITVSVLNFPDSYTIVFVNPVQQSVVVSLVWGTTSTNLVSSAAVAQLGSAGISEYINSINVGQPINLFDMQAVFQASIETLVPISLITKMQFTVSIDGTPVPPVSGTGIINGDPEGYFTTSASTIFITQG